jgi:hypothetical protein
VVVVQKREKFSTKICLYHKSKLDVLAAAFYKYFLLNIISLFYVYIVCLAFNFHFKHPSLVKIAALTKPAAIVLLLVALGHQFRFYPYTLYMNLMKGHFDDRLGAGVGAFFIL